MTQYTAPSKDMLVDTATVVHGLKEGLLFRRTSWPPTSLFVFLEQAHTDGAKVLVGDVERTATIPPTIHLCGQTQGGLVIVPYPMAQDDILAVDWVQVVDIQRTNSVH